MTLMFESIIYAKLTFRLRSQRTLTMIQSGYRALCNASCASFCWTLLVISGDTEWVVLPLVCTPVWYSCFPDDHLIAHLGEDNVKWHPISFLVRSLWRGANCYQQTNKYLAETSTLVESSSLLTENPIIVEPWIATTIQTSEPQKQ